jgi:hypothetical protein
MEFLFPGVMVVLTAIILLCGGLLFNYSKQVLTFPVMIGCLAGLSALQIMKPLVRRMPGADEEKTLLPELTNLLMIGTILPFLLIFGFVAGPALWLAGFMRVRGENWRLAGAIGAGTLFFVYVVFAGLLKIPLPAGLLPG